MSVELLHHLGMADDTSQETLRSAAYDIMNRLDEKGAPQEEYIIANLTDMIRTAAAYGIPVADRKPEEIARAIAREIVADYLPDRTDRKY